MKKKLIVERELKLTGSLREARLYLLPLNTYRPPETVTIYKNCSSWGFLHWNGDGTVTYERTTKSAPWLTTTYPVEWVEKVR